MIHTRKGGKGGIIKTRNQERENIQVRRLFQTKEY